MGKMSCLVVILFICLINIASGFGVSGEKGCNATLEECFSHGGDVEAGDLLRHYAAGARWLLQAKRNPTYDNLNKGLTKPCKTSRYYPDCLRKNPTKFRPCAPYQHCRL